MPTIAFGRTVRKWRRLFEINSTKMVKNAAKKGLEVAVLKTKVDTGKARSNWRVGIGTTPQKVIEPYFPYPKRSQAKGQGSGETANAGAAIAAGNARINAVRGTPFRGLTKSIILANRIPYFFKVESGQADAAAQAGLAFGTTSVRILSR